MKIRSAVPEKGCLIFLRTEKNEKKQKKNKKQKKKNICKTYTHPPHRRLRKLDDIIYIHNLVTPGCIAA